MKGYRLLLPVLLVLCVARPAKAQLSVIDEANLLENTVQTIQQILMVLSWGMDLASLGEDSLGGSFADDAGAIAGLASDVNALSFDISQLNAQLAALFALETAPASSWSLQTRTREVRRLYVQAYSYAMRTQTLLGTISRTIEHLMSITNRIGELFGTVSAQQNGQQYLAKITQLETQTNLQVAAFQRAQSIKEADPSIEIQAVENIKFNVRADMPR